MAEIFLNIREQFARKANSTLIQIQILFKKNIKNLTKTLSVSICPKLA